MEICPSNPLVSYLFLLTARAPRHGLCGRGRYDWPSGSLVLFPPPLPHIFRHPVDSLSQLTETCLNCIQTLDNLTCLVGVYRWLVLSQDHQHGLPKILVLLGFEVLVSLPHSLNGVFVKQACPLGLRFFVVDAETFRKDGGIDIQFLGKFRAKV